MSVPIKAGILTEGLSNLVMHALRGDGSAACSSYLMVSPVALARHVDKKNRCKSRACQKLFKAADMENNQ